VSQASKSSANFRDLPKFMEWRLPDPVDPALSARFAGELGVSPAVVPVLAKRSEGDIEKARRLLVPSCSSLPDPAGLPGMRAAARRLIEAIARNEPMVVYSDFDADGVTGAVVIKEALDFAGAKGVSVYFPSRFEEGYGFHVSSVRELSSRGPCLFITTDCGITGVEGCLEAALQSSDVIITDHHLPGERLPEAYSILNPHLPEWAPFGLRDLTGAGVAYLLAAALFREAGIEGDVPESWAHDLLTLSIAGDGHPVVGLNRHWVVSGLSSLRNTRRPGIAALLEVAGICGPGGAKRPLSFDRDVTFGLVPRLNAAGRLEDARHAYKLLVEKDPLEARRLALHLDRLNRDRRGMEETIMTDCFGGLWPEGNVAYAICIAGSDWHEGVIGIVASRLREAFGRPAVLAAGNGELLRGSVRGIPGFNVVEALSRCAEFLVGFGGHGGAGGFTVRRESLQGFFDRFKTVSAELLSSATLRAPLDLDGLLELGEASDETLKGLLALEPFGQGNEVPLMACLGLSIQDIWVMGKSGEHLKLRLSQGGVAKEFIWFGMGSVARSVALMGRVDVAFVPYRNVYLGEERFSSLVRDLRPSWEESGKGYEEIVGDIAVASGNGERSVVYTWSPHAAWSLWVALRKAGLQAALHLEGESLVQAHEANLVLSSPGGVVVSTAPWELERLGQAKRTRVIVAHEPVVPRVREELSAFCRDRGFPCLLRPELHENSMSWFSWTYPEKESVQLVWKSLKERSNDDSVPYTCFDEVRRVVMENVGYKPQLPGVYEGGRLLLEKVLAILEEMGSLEYGNSRRVPVVRLRTGRKFHLADSPTYVESKRVRQQRTLKARLHE